MSNVFQQLFSKNKNQGTPEARLLLEAFSSLKTGSLELTTPDGMLHSFKGEHKGPVVSMKVHDWKVFSEILNKSDIGLAETYIEKAWDVSSVAALIELSILNEEALKAAFLGNWAKILYYRMKHEARENTKVGSKKNISAHYDLGNDFYSLWLDSTMSYSSALFLHPDQSLEEAQQNKYQSMLDLVGANAGDHLVEIGCGWGGFLEYAGKKGIKVTGITISDEQYAFAHERLKKVGLDSFCQVQLCDYRDLNGQFDHAVSIEMIEAVGEKYWDSYFSLFKRVVRPGGKFAVQAIVIRDDKFESYRKGTDFIQQYIFPGGMLLSPGVIKKQLADKHYANQRFLSFGKDYAKTLQLWNAQFSQKARDIEALGFDEKFQRLWSFYLGYCDGAFLAERIDVIQFSASVS